MINMICEILLDEVPSFMCAIKCQPPGKSTNMNNSRKMRGREKNFLSIINDQSKTLDQTVVPAFRY